MNSTRQPVAVTGIPHGDQDWGCASCGYNYEWAAVRHYYADGTGMPYHWDLSGGSTFDLSVSAKTEVKLYTGGKAAISRNNVFQISAGASEILRPPLDYGPTYPWWDVPAPAIAPAALKVAGKTLGADGNLWLVLPDNSEQDLTVKAPGIHHFDAWSGAQKYKVYIDANSHNLDNETPEFCVGQRVTFTLQGLPGDVVDMIGQWGLPGKYVNEAYPYSSTCTSYRINSSLLENTNQTSCWFVNGQGGQVSVGLNLKFQNGQTASVAADGSLTVYRPTFSGFSTVNPDFPSSSRSFLWNGSVLSYGDIETGEHGLYWSVNVDSKYDGSIGILQLANVKYTQNYGFLPFRTILDTGGDSWLDGSSENYQEAAYLTSIVASRNIFLDDHPQGDLWAFSPINVRLWGAFTDYLRFKPGGTDSIFITLGINTWSMVGLGSTFSGLFINGTPAPSVPSDSDQFPTWIQIKSE